MEKAGGGAFSAGGEEHLDTEEGIHRKFWQNRNYLVISIEGRCLEVILRSKEQNCRTKSESWALAQPLNACARGVVAPRFGWDLRFWDRVQLCLLSPLGLEFSCTLSWCSECNSHHPEKGRSSYFQTVNEDIRWSHIVERAWNLNLLLPLFI